MMLEYRKKNIDIISCKYNKHNINDNIISEALGSFNNQHNLAIELANVVYNNYLKNILNFEYLTTNNDIFKVKFIIDDTSMLNRFNVSIIALNNIEKLITIKIYLSSQVKKQDSRYIINQLTSSITHELMYGNVFLKRLNNNVEISDEPIYYQNIISVIQTVDPDTILYKFSYALYATYYQEVNAIVSQTSTQLYNILGYGCNHNNETIKNAIKNTESYIIYNMILNEVVPCVENMTDSLIENLIIKPLKQFNINLTINDINKKTKYIKLISEKALHNILRNAMLQTHNIN